MPTPNQILDEKEVAEIAAMFPHAEYQPTLSPDEVDPCEFCKGTIDDHKANCVVPHVHALCATVKQLRNKTCPECATTAPDGSGYCRNCDSFTMPSDFSLRWVRRTQLDDLQSQLEQLRAENERLKLRITQMERDARDDAAAASSEARWQERQGDDYGSY